MNLFYGGRSWCHYVCPFGMVQMVLTGPRGLLGGITPMMSMSRWICDTVSNVDIIFLHSARSPEDIIFRQELEMMTARYPNFKLAITVTRAVPGQPWYGYTGRINETILPAIALDYQDRTVYVCGPNPFMEAIKELLQKIDFPMENYYEESFGGAKKKKAAAPPTANQTSVVPPSIPTPNITPPAVTSAVPPTSLVNGYAPPSSAEPVQPAKQAEVASPAPPASLLTPVVVLVKSGQEISCDGVVIEA